MGNKLLPRIGSKKHGDFWLRQYLSENKGHLYLRRNVLEKNVVSATKTRQVSPANAAHLPPNGSGEVALRLGLG
jgi:hypothetical protein